MTDQTVTIIVAIITALGSGALGSFITALASRKKTAADVMSAVMNVAEKRLQSMSERSTMLEGKLSELEAEICQLRLEIRDREIMIHTLQIENTELKATVDKLVTQNKDKDRQIASLTKRIKELESRLDQIGSADGNDCD